ncbi:MAG TPA: hypothetical protein PLB04_09320, partial [Nitrospira sp.]|nr:hypothetical protein [Nitrospira sp.]
IPGLDFWTGEVAHVTELGVEIDFDSSHLAGRYSGGGGVVRHDKAKFFDAFNLVISDIRHMAVRHGSGEVVLIIMTPPTEWTGGRNDGSIRHLNTALCQLAGKWQAHFYNLTTDLDIGPAQLRDILPDGVHPTTPAGRALIADHIAAWARRGSISPSLSGTR